MKITAFYRNNILVGQGQTYNEYVSSASFNVIKCWPPWLGDE